MRTPIALACAAWLAVPAAQAQSPYQSSADFMRYAMKLRENALLKIEPQVFIPTTSRSTVGGKYPWKLNIVSTVFWVGEDASQNNPVHNRSSSWDKHWAYSFGGLDDPDPSRRRGFIPASFIPRQNPFYVALPYNDVTRGTTKPEARRVIPWFNQVFEREGRSVCQNRWVAVRKGKRVAYAQWADCGPFRTDHWEYVFGNERPKPNLNQGAGLDVSPAVRDFLGMRGGKDLLDWKFVEVSDVPPGPWTMYGENNEFVQRRMRTGRQMAQNQPRGTPSAPVTNPGAPAASDTAAPRVFTR